MLLWAPLHLSKYRTVSLGELRYPSLKKHVFSFKDDDLKCRTFFFSAKQFSLSSL